jgi:hypothetical protein
VNVDVRLGEPVGVGDYGRSVWEKEITLEARLPEAHQRKIAQDTLWRCSDGRRRRVRLAPRRLHNLLRDDGKRRLSSGVWRPPLTPPRVWIYPGKTPTEVTKMALLLIFWQEGMVELGPDNSPDAWAWVKRWTGAKDDAECWEIATEIRQHYVVSEDWRALRMYLAKVRRGLRVRRGDAQDYALPLRDGFPADPGTSDADGGESAELETSQ